MKSETDYTQLLLKTWRKEASADDLAALQAWINESNDHAQLAGDLKAIWGKSAAYVPEFAETDTGSAYSAIRQKSGLDQAAKPDLFIVRRIARVAAVLVLVVSATWFFARNAKSTAWQTCRSNGPVVEQVLPDQSRVWLTAGAEIRFPGSFDSKTRPVSLKGDAFFEVTRQDNLPFVIETGNGSKITVLGTAFGVSAVPDAGVLSVWVREGRVLVTPKSGHEGVVLGAGDRVVYDIENGQLLLSKPGIDNQFAWHNGGLTFIKTPLRKVIHDMEVYYRVKIHLKNEGIADCPYSSPLTNGPVEETLASLASAFQIELKKQAEAEYSLEGGVCK